MGGWVAGLLGGVWMDMWVGVWVSRCVFVDNWVAGWYERPYVGVLSYLGQALIVGQQSHLTVGRAFHIL